MKRMKPLLLVAFLMVLIAPLFLASSSSYTAILTEPNKVKDFQVASWYDPTFHYRQNVTITGATGAGTDYQVRIDVTYDSDMQDDFDDIVFTDNDQVTPLDFWLESYVANTSAIFWVEVSDSLETSGSIQMYYGNSTASTASDGEATFLLFDDFNDASFDTGKWDVKNNAPVEAGGVITCEDTATEGFASDNSFTYGKIRGNVKLDADVSGSYFGKFGFLGDWGGGDVASTSFWEYDDTTIRARTTTDSQDIGDYDGAFYTYEIRWTAANAEYLIADSGLVTLTSGVHSGASYASGYEHDADGAVTIDWVFVGKQSLNEPVVASFGDEEIGPVWNVIDDPAILRFVTPFYMWGFDTALIILGLVMIPVSMLYLAYGIIHDRSSDRLFYGLIIFFVGCGLFIGGILP